MIDMMFDLYMLSMARHNQCIYFRSRRFQPHKKKHNLLDTNNNLLHNSYNLCLNHTQYNLFSTKHNFYLYLHMCYQDKKSNIILRLNIANLCIECILLEKYIFHNLHGKIYINFLNLKMSLMGNFNNIFYRIRIFKSYKIGILH